jgi:hypothetical protein
MNFSLGDLIWVLLLIMVGIYWWRSRGHHGIALASAKKYCFERDIQLLDETLVFSKFAITRAANRKRYFTRIYTFDFCRDGMDRHKGEIIMHGYLVLRVMLEGDALEITEYH